MTNAKFSTTSIDILPTYNAMFALLHLPTSNFVSRYILSDVNGGDGPPAKTVCVGRGALRCQISPYNRDLS